MKITEELMSKIQKYIEHNIINGSIKSPPIINSGYKFIIDHISHYNNYIKIHIVIESTFSKQHETFYIINNALY